MTGASSFASSSFLKAVYSSADGVPSVTGIGYAAIQHAFALLPEVTTWKLDTILQEKGNCHLYEKCGFVRVGGEEIINDKMTIVFYELNL